MVAVAARRAARLLLRGPRRRLRGQHLQPRQSLPLLGLPDCHRAGLLAGVDQARRLASAGHRRLRPQLAALVAVAAWHVLLSLPACRAVPGAAGGLLPDLAVAA